MGSTAQNPKVKYFWSGSWTWSRVLFLLVSDSLFWRYSTLTFFFLIEPIFPSSHYDVCNPHSYPTMLFFLIWTTTKPRKLLQVTIFYAVTDVRCLTRSSHSISGEEPNERCERTPAHDDTISRWLILIHQLWIYPIPGYFVNLIFPQLQYRHPGDVLTKYNGSCRHPRCAHSYVQGTIVHMFPPITQWRSFSEYGISSRTTGPFGWVWYSASSFP